MKFLSSQVIDVLVFLLPGFVAAATFNSLTSYPKPSIFEQIIQALIFTILGRAVVELIGAFCCDDSENSDNCWIYDYLILMSVSCSVILAVVTAILLNKDFPHRWLRAWKITRETSYPSEWYSAFSRYTSHNCFVVLHLIDGRRLYGYPDEWPSHPVDGHFHISEYRWLCDEENENEQSEEAVLNKGAILIPSNQVTLIEFLYLEPLTSS